MRFSVLLALMGLLLAQTTFAATHCAQDDMDCWGKNSVSSGQIVLSSVKVLKDLDPGKDWKTVYKDSDLNCIVGGQKVVADQATDTWQLDTSSEMGKSYQNVDYYSVDLDITIPRSGDQPNSWLTLACTNTKHWVQPEDFQKAFAGMLDLQFKVMGDN